MTTTIAEHGETQREPEGDVNSRVRDGAGAVEEAVNPGEASRRLGLPASTLRIYSVKLAAALSPRARGAAGQRGVRGYTGSDLQTLARAKALLAGGMTYAEAVKELLPVETAITRGAASLSGEKPVATRLDADAMLEQAASTAIAVAKAWERLALERQEALLALQARLEVLESELRRVRQRKPWWRSLLGG